MAESMGVTLDVAPDANYRKARDLLRKISEEMYEMKGRENNDPERLERLEQKASSITKIIEFVEWAFKDVEEEDWQPKLPGASAPLERRSDGQDDSRERDVNDIPEPNSSERKGVRQDNLQDVDDMREPPRQQSRTDEDGWRPKLPAASTSLEQRKDVRPDDLREVTDAWGRTRQKSRTNEEDDWPPRSPAASALLERRSGRQDNPPEIHEIREPPGQQSRANEAVLGVAAVPAVAATYRPLEEPYRPSSAPSQQTLYQTPQAFPRAASTVAPVEQQNFRPSDQPSEEHSMPHRPPEAYRLSLEASHQPPYQPPQAAPRALSPPNTTYAARQQTSRPKLPPSEERQMALRPRGEQTAPPRKQSSVEDENYEVPSNISFSHGPRFSDCIASMELSNVVYDLEEAKEDLTRAKEKLHEAEERGKAEKVDRYMKRLATTEKEVRELEAEHWRREVQPLRRAYYFEVSRCLRQVAVAMKYTESLQNESHSQGEQGKMEANALRDMGLLQEWLELCLRQPKTWRKDDRLFVGLTKGHPGPTLKDPEYVNDLLQETAQADPTSRQNSRTNGKEPKAANDDSDSALALTTAMVTPDLLEGILNGAMPKEVAESIQECPECKGTGGDIEHAKICSQCEGAGKNPDSEEGVIEMCPKCSGRGFRLSRKYRCPTCDGFKIVLQVPEGSKASQREISPTEADNTPKRRSSTKHASFEKEPEVLSESDSRSDSRKLKKHRDYSPEEVPSDSRKSRKHRDYSPEEETHSPRSASTGPSQRRRRSESRKQPDPAQGLTAALSAVFEASKEPGSWKGEKGMRVLNAALGAGGGALGGGAVSDSGKSDDNDESDGYEKKPRRKRRGSTRH